MLEQLTGGEYTAEKVREIRRVLEKHKTLEIEPVAHGLFAASGSQAADSTTGYQNVWIRDNVMVANAFRLLGNAAKAIACVKGLTEYLETQRGRMTEIIEDPTRLLKEDVQRRPHIRFAAQTLGDLPEKWPHAQNDALGELLWLRFVLANSGAMPLGPAEFEIFGLLTEYFEAIEYWQDEDSGAWEEERKINASSVGAVVAGLEEMMKYKSGGAGGMGGGAGVVSISTARVDRLERMIAKGRERLEKSLPFESPPERMADAALLSLVYPLGVVRERGMQDAILNLVQARLKGEAGIKRYVGDSYFCQDYDEWFGAGELSSDFSERVDYRDAFLQPGCEAQWCLFDPVLSIIYGERYLADPSDEKSREKQMQYFDRSMRQITERGESPELYFLKAGRYVANAHTPLAWTQANQAVALQLAEKSFEVKS